MKQNNNLGSPARDPWLKKQWDRANGAGKGDRARSVDKAQFDAEYERIFGKKNNTLKVWDENDPDHPRYNKEKNVPSPSDR